MKEIQMMNHGHFRKTVLLFLSLFLLASLSLSSSFLHIEHECTGDDCPVCAVILSVKSNLQNLHVAPDVFVQVQQKFGETFLLILPLIFMVSLTPVSTKIRLNN